MMIAKMTHRLTNFFRKDIWALNMEELSKAKARFVRYAKVAIITMKTFSNEKIGFQAVALSFFSAMAVVPFIAIVFAVTDGLGFADVMKDLTYSVFENSQQTIDTILGFSQNLISQAEHSAMGLISSIIFSFVVIKLMLNVEKVFNNVWRVRERRSFIKRLSYVLIMIIISPFVVLLFFFGTVLYSHTLDFLGVDIENFGILKTMLSWTLFSASAAFILALMYKFIPNAEVSFGTAFRAALPAAIAFTLIQYLYLETQVLVTNMSTVYGAFAAVPLFLMWLNIGWFIILIGAELSYAFQHVDSYNIED